MKQLIKNMPFKGILATIFFSVVQLSVFAQDKIEIDKKEVGNWFQQNWMWVVGGVILLLIIVLSGSRSRTKSRSTTIVKDEYGNTKRVTTTEVDN